VHSQEQELPAPHDCGILAAHSGVTVSTTFCASAAVPHPVSVSLLFIVLSALQLSLHVHVHLTIGEPQPADDNNAAKASDKRENERNI
jgi:hypothetical protein